MRLLGTGNREPAVEDEERHRLNARAPGECVGVADRFHPLMACQQCGNEGFRDPHGHRFLPQHRRLADIAAATEVSVEQPVNQRIGELGVGLGHLTDQTVPVQGAGGSANRVKVQV